MKKILYFAAAFMAASTSITTTTSCHFAPDQNDGDTVAASVFYTIDTAAIRAAKAAGKVTTSCGPDSIGMYFIGSGSDKQSIQLVSYPSRRDTFVYGKTRHVKVKGSADIGRIVRVQFYLLNNRDSLVKSVEEVEQPASAQM